LPCFLTPCGFAFPHDRSSRARRNLRGDLCRNAARPRYAPDYAGTAAIGRRSRSERMLAPTSIIGSNLSPHHGRTMPFVAGDARSLIRINAWPKVPGNNPRGKAVVFRMSRLCLASNLLVYRHKQLLTGNGTTLPRCRYTSAACCPTRPRGPVALETIRRAALASYINRIPSPSSTAQAEVGHRMSPSEGELAHSLFLHLRSARSSCKESPSQ